MSKVDRGERSILYVGRDAWEPLTPWVIAGRSRDRPDPWMDCAWFERGEGKQKEGTAKVSVKDDWLLLARGRRWEVGDAAKHTS